MKLYYRLLTRIWISLVSLASCFMLVSLSGCSSMLSSKMPPGSISMKQAYNQALNEGDDTEDTTDTDAAQKPEESSLSALRHEVQSPTQHRLSTDSLSVVNNLNEINTQFPQVPNPGIVMYVYPHLAGEGANQVPVPGYSTVFSLYQRNYYLPNF